jgi:phosphatidylglycerophosphate synthase
MTAGGALGRSIIRHGALFLAAQWALLAGVTWAYGMRWPRCFLFMAVSAVFHVVLTWLLYWRREDFRPVIVPLMCLVFVTDFLDGIIARRRGEITFVGRYLDSTSDYLMIIALSIAFFYYELIPTWFFALIIARLVLFALGMAILAVRSGQADPQATFMGKASIFAVMVLYVMEIAGLLGVPFIGNDAVVRYTEYAVAAVIAASFVDKAVFLARRFTSPRTAHRPPSAGRSA